MESRPPEAAERTANVRPAHSKQRALPVGRGRRIDVRVEVETTA